MFKLVLHKIGVEKKQKNEGGKACFLVSGRIGEGEEAGLS